jgi:hypothetical protein
VNLTLAENFYKVSIVANVGFLEEDSFRSLVKEHLSAEGMTNEGKK